MSFDPTVDRAEPSQSDKTEGRYFIGTVINLNDPEGLGRVQANVPGQYDPTLGDVPWIGPVRQSPFGIGPGFGFYGVPALNSKITVIFQDGDPHYPLYIGGVLTKDDVQPEFKDPNVWGFKDPAGNTVIYDMAAKTYKFITAGGAVVTIDGGGKRVTQVNGDTTNSQGDWSVNVQGNASINASGNLTLHAGGTASYTASAHQFMGPVTMSSTLSTGGDITDDTLLGNTQTQADMRRRYNIHTHLYDDNGNPNHTQIPDQPI